MSESLDYRTQLARAFAAALDHGFNCGPDQTDQGDVVLVEQELAGSPMTSPYAVRWIHQQGTRFATRVQGRFYKEDGQLYLVLSQLRIPGMADLRLAPGNQSYLVTFPSGDIVVRRLALAEA